MDDRSDLPEAKAYRGTNDQRRRVHEHVVAFLSALRSLEDFASMRGRCSGVELRVQLDWEVLISCCQEMWRWNTEGIREDFAKVSTPGGYLVPPGLRDNTAHGAVLGACFQVVTRANDLSEPAPSAEWIIDFIRYFCPLSLGRDEEEQATREEMFDRMELELDGEIARLLALGERSTALEQPRIEYVDPSRVYIVMGPKRAEIRGRERVWVFQQVVQRAPEIVTWRSLVEARMHRDGVELEARWESERERQKWMTEEGVPREKPVDDVATPRMALKPESFQTQGSRIKKLVSEIGPYWNQSGHGAWWSGPTGSLSDQAPSDS